MQKVLTLSVNVNLLCLKKYTKDNFYIKDCNNIASC